MTGIPGRMPALAVGLLVGGASRRMGRAKALVRLGDATLAERAAAAAAAVSAELYLLGAGPVPPALADAPRLADRAGLRGPLAAALAALAARPDRAWLLLACDQGLVTAAACLWLAAERAPERIAILPRRSDAGVEPLLAIYEPAARAALERIAAAGDGSLQALAAVAGVATPTPPAALLSAWTSIDDPATLAALEARAAEVQKGTPRR